MRFWHHTAATFFNGLLRLNVKVCALTAGILWSVGVFFMTWWIILVDGQTGENMLPAQKGGETQAVSPPCVHRVFAGAVGRPSGATYNLKAATSSLSCWD